SLTELFSRDLIALRMGKLREHYPWLSTSLDYFEARLHQAPEDVAFTMDYVEQHAKTREDQEKVIQALRDKCDILWAQLDALYFAYVQPAWPPPGAFRIEEWSWPDFSIRVNPDSPPDAVGAAKQRALCYFRKVPSGFRARDREFWS